MNIHYKKDLALLEAFNNKHQNTVLFLLNNGADKNALPSERISYEEGTNISRPNMSRNQKNKLCYERIVNDEETVSIEDPISLEIINNPLKIIRTVTVDVDSNNVLNARYHCFDVEQLYNWTIVQKHNTNPMTKGVFNKNSLIEIEERMNKLNFI